MPGRNFRPEQGVLAPTVPSRTTCSESSCAYDRLRSPPSSSSTLGAGASPVSAADGLTMEAHVLLDGNARVGSWMAIAVHLKNDGPAIDGELRLAGGAQGRTRFGTVVDLPTQSDKTFLLYAQPPAFGRELQIALVADGQAIATTKAEFTIHDTNQLTVAVIAERPGDVIGGIDLLPNQNQLAPAVIAIDPEDLPERVEAWGGLDRIVWQDIDSHRLSPAQLDALRGWVASGGRLIIIGGTAGPSSLSAFPDGLLPYRPTATVDVAASSLTGLLGTTPEGVTDLPALGGALTAGRTLATVGDRAIAAERSYGTGAVAIIGFDPTTKWIADGRAAGELWRRMLPPRTAATSTLGDDSQLVSAVSQLPALALPPIEGLIVLLGAYILLVGPINYLVLRRLDRREWAWVTMPVLIVVFAVGAYAFGSVLRGSDVIVNEVAVVRGPAGTTDGAAQVYIGVFSPSRGSYQVQVPGGALLSAPISGDVFGGDTGAALDVLQGDPARIRDLGVSFGSLRTIRAETPMSLPLIGSELQVVDGRLKGTITNQSTITLQKPAVVLGATVVLLDDIAAGATATVDAALQSGQAVQTLSDRVVGPTFFGDPNDISANTMNLYIRHTMVDQLTFDPTFGGGTTTLQADGAVILAWGSGSLLPIEIAGQTPRASGNILYYMPAAVAVHGTTTFRADMLRSSIIDSDAQFFSMDPYTVSFGRGSATIAYRPISFEGTFRPTEVSFGLNWGGDQRIPVKGQPVAPLPEIPPACTDTTQPGCDPNGFDGMPEVELFDITAAQWVRLPHLTMGSRYSLDHPDRYVDPASGSVLTRFVNDRSDTVGFSFDLSLTGDIR